jgi:hypothetical protein
MMDNRTFRQRDTIFVKARTLRTEDLHLFERWVDRVIASETLLPILVTGPSLFQPPKRFGEKELDRNIANYADYPEIMEGLMKLSSHGRPPLALTGDVHYGRVISAIHATGNPARTWSKMHEIISSPSALVMGPHKPAKVPDSRFTVEGTGSILRCSLMWPTTDPPTVGNHVALLKFARTQTGADLDTTYWLSTPTGQQAVETRQAPQIPLQRFPDSTID